MIFRHFIFLLIVLILPAATPAVFNSSFPGFSPQGHFEIPETRKGDHVIHHKAYSLLYNEKYEQANWVAYQLTAAETNKKFERNDDFIPDPMVPTGTADDIDYAGSKYDRGHLAPASDMGWSLTTMAESFYYSNMSPQIPGFNRGIWKKLEELTRTWAIENDSIYIVTGPVLRQGLKTIGPDSVAVPEYFYKVLLDYSAPELKGIGFIIPNKKSSKPLQYFALSIDSVETITGINFFPSIPTNKESKLESSVCNSCWSWNGKPEIHHAKKTALKSARCHALNNDGSRCKRMTANTSRKCYVHK